MRIFKYDLVRSVAIIFVVSVHCLIFIDATNPLNDCIVRGLRILFFSGNALFFLLSGKFNLRERADDNAIRRFYYNKIRNILLPFLIATLLCTLMDTTHVCAPVSIAKTYLKNITYAYNSGVYWFVFALAGMLVVSPFLAHAFPRFTKFEKKVFAVIGLSYNALLVLAVNLGHQFAWGYLFSGFSFVFCLGIFIEDYFPRPFPRAKCLALIATCLVASVALILAGAHWGMQDISPLYTVMSIGIYGFLLNLGDIWELRIRPTVKKSISFIAQHSFTVYLIHMMPLNFLSTRLPIMQGTASFGLFACYTVMIFCTSLFASWALDTLVINQAKKLLDYVASNVIGCQKTLR